MTTYKITFTQPDRVFVKLFKTEYKQQLKGLIKHYKEVFTIDSVKVEILCNG